MALDIPALPRWDMIPVFPGPDSPEFGAAFAAALQAMADLAELFDALGVGPLASPPDTEAAVGTVEEVIRRYNETQDAVQQLDIYLSCLVATDADDARAQAALSELRQHAVELAQLAARFTAWVGSLPVEGLLERSGVAQAHAYALRLTQQAAAHLMSPAEEELAAELGPSGAAAWSRLRQDIEARLTLRLEIDGTERTLSISEALNLALHPDREVRRRAHEAEDEAWHSAEAPLAAALNGVKGETNVLTARRRWADPLDAALFQNRIDQQVLDALLEAVRAAVPDYRRYLRAKARALGLPVLAWYDLLAPVGAATRPWPFAEAADFVAERFADYSPTLGALARRAVVERWIDAEPRPGKEGGGFCADVGGGRSRILLNYAPSYFWLSALAHELGHAYHNAIQHEAGRTWLQRQLMRPMTLAETASTFCETLVHRAAMAQANGAEALAILGGVLLSVDANVFGAITSFAFERELFGARRRRELTSDELGELTVASLRDLFGDAVDLGTLPRRFWAALPHPFLPERWYYNFPYAFGMLFGLGLHARYEADPEAFRPGFDDLLSRTAMAEAGELARLVGIDLRSPAFWRGSLDTVRADIDRFEAMAAAATPPTTPHLLP